MAYTKEYHENKIYQYKFREKTKTVSEVGFEPTPPFGDQKPQHGHNCAER